MGIIVEIIFRILRNSGGADRSDSLGPIATEGGHVPAVENTAPLRGGTAGTGVIRLEAGAVPGISHGPSPVCGAFQ
jgi:hypothetical protein